MGRVMPLVVPPIELATIMYVGAHTDIDLAYGALATYVAQHALAVEGPGERVLCRRSARHRRRDSVALPAAFSPPHFSSVSPHDGRHL